jgi:hypothetical protein
MYLEVYTLWKSHWVFLTGYLLCLTEETRGNASQCDRPNDRDFSLFVISKSMMHDQSPCGIKATFNDFWVRFVGKGM